MLAAALCSVVGPLLVPRSLAGVARFSRFGVACVLGLAATICLLAGTAAVEGRLAPDVRLLPDPSAMGGGTPLGIATSILAVVSGESAAAEGTLLCVGLAVDCDGPVC